MISPGLEVINTSGLMAAWLDLSISPYLVAISKLALLMSAFVTFVKSLETVNTLFAASVVSVLTLIFRFFSPASRLKIVMRSVPKLLLFPFASSIKLIASPLVSLTTTFKIPVYVFFKLIVKVPSFTLLVDAKRLPLTSNTSTLSPSLFTIGPAAINPDKARGVSDFGVVVTAVVCAPPPDEPPLLPPSASAPSPAPMPAKLNDGVADATEVETGVAIDTCETIVSA